MTEPTTIRGINEAQKAQHHPERNNERVCSYCFRIHPCDDFNRAVAALDLLDNAEWDIFEDSAGIVALVPDGSAYEHDGTCWRRKTDPAPRGEA